MPILPKQKQRAGRKRSETAREAILQSALALARRHGVAAVTMERIAAEAGVGKQTIYRWWPSRGAVLLEGLGDAAEVEVALPDEGSLRGDLRAFVRATFRAALIRGNGPLLCGLMAEAQLDPALHAPFRRFIDRRRDALAALIGRHRLRAAQVTLALDLTFGVLWYRLLVLHDRLDDKDADALVDAVLATVR
jgi:AcrR family transcriptional regulator